MVDYKISQPIEVQLTKQEKNEYCNETKAYTDRLNKLEVHHGQVYSLILGQCTQLLQDKMKQESLWSVVSGSYKPLQLYTLLEKVVMKQTDDQYP